MNDFKPTNSFEGYVKGCLEGVNREICNMKKDFTKSIDEVKLMFSDRNRAELKVWMALFVIFFGSLGQLGWLIWQISDMNRKIIHTEERRVEDSLRVDRLYQDRSHIIETDKYHQIDIPLK